jgi:hypothetical protein
MSEQQGTENAPVTDWEQRKLAIIHDTALAMSEGGWDALRWHFAEVWDDAYECCVSDGTPQFHNGNPYRADAADAVIREPHICTCPPRWAPRDAGEHVRDCPMAPHNRAARVTPPESSAR